MKFHIFTLFPEVFNEYPNVSILKRARQKKLIDMAAYNIRDWAKDKHHKVDDIPYGGGPGMVMKVEPIHKAVSSVLKKIEARNAKRSQKGEKKEKVRVVLFSTRGKKFDNEEAKRLSRYDHLLLICGRYEGVDERVAQYIADEEISIGEYVLSGGELPALVVMDGVSRQIPGVLGKLESLEELKGSYPAYTKPEIVLPDPKNSRKKWVVPKVLLSGDHKKIEAFRRGEKAS